MLFDRNIHYSIRLQVRINSARKAYVFGISATGKKYRKNPPPPPSDDLAVNLAYSEKAPIPIANSGSMCNAIVHTLWWLHEVLMNMKRNAMAHAVDDDDSFVCVCCAAYKTGFIVYIVLWNIT